MPKRLEAFSIAIAMFLGCVQPTFAAVIYSGAPLSENFDTLGPAMTGHFSATIGTQNTIPGLATWDGVKNGGTGTANMNFVEDAGTAISGALYSYGAAGSNERALGGLGSGSNSGAFGVEIQNSSGQPITEVFIDFTSEQWRSSTSTTNILAFSYGTSSGGETSTAYLTSPTMTAFSALDAPGKPFVATNGPTDGNLAANQTVVSSSFSVNVPAGGSLFIRWSDFNDVGSDAGIGIDNLNFRAVPEPTSLVFVVLGIAAMTFRRFDA
jgi:hypothetical protein